MYIYIYIYIQRKSDTIYNRIYKEGQEGTRNSKNGDEKSDQWTARIRQKFSRIVFFPMNHFLLVFCGISGSEMRPRDPPGTPRDPLGRLKSDQRTPRIRQKPSRIDIFPVNHFLLVFCRNSGSMTPPRDPGPRDDPGPRKTQQREHRDTKQDKYGNNIQLQNGFKQKKHDPQNKRNPKRSY